MEWVKLGQELPLEDESGQRPELDEDGNRRETEFMPYEKNGMEVLEFELVDPTLKQRRILDYQLENLLQGKTLSVIHGADSENFFADLVRRFVRGVRHGESKAMLRKKEMESFFEDEFKSEDFYALLATVRRHCELADSKKKNWNSRFGLPTE